MRRTAASNGVRRSCSVLGMLWVLIATAGTAAYAQVTVFVPGNASGYFGNPADEVVPLVAGITVSGPTTITVTYESGTVTDAGGVNTGPDGVSYPAFDGQFPLEEAKGVAPHTAVTNLDALIGAFVPQSTVNASGFMPVDGTKNAAPVGVLPNTLFFIGTKRTICVKQAGTLFLGINDMIVHDNGGGFTVTLSTE